MTDRSILSPYLDDDEIQSMIDDGKDFALNKDIEKLFSIAQKYLDAGQDEKYIELLNSAYDTKDFYKEKIYNITGWSVEYNEESKRWYSTETGHFAPDPYAEWNQSNDEFEIAIFEKYQNWGG